MSDKFYKYEFVKVERVIDGDTVHLTIDLGFKIIRFDESYRLAHINAPEMSTPEGRHCRAELMTYLVGKKLFVDSLGPDKYGRWLIILYANGVSVNDWLVQQGLAFPWEGQGKAPTT